MLRLVFLIVYAACILECVLARDAASCKQPLLSDIVCGCLSAARLEPIDNVRLIPVQTCNLLPVWASCIVWATSCSKLNMFNIAQLVARCDFLLLKQATCCVDKLLILSRHATCCRQQVACLDGALCCSVASHVAYRLVCLCFRKCCCVSFSVWCVCLCV